MMDADPFGHKRCSRCEDAGTKPARERALNAALEADGRTTEAETREYLREIVDVVLAAIGYPHESSDEGTCWCPVAEQAGRERDEVKAERDRFRAVLAKIEYGGHSEGCNRAHGVAHQWAQRPACNCHMREVCAALDAKGGT